MSAANKAAKSSGSNGIGFVGLLTILFIYLKLTGQINWSWWWVWSPVWICVIVVLGLLIVGGVGYFFYLWWTDA